MKKDNEQYKRIIRIFLVVVLVACETSFFMYSWIKSYNLYTVFPFFQKGHCMMAGMYVMYQMIFLYIFGGLKVGYLKKANIIYSQILALICANIVMYLQIVLLSVRFVNVGPLLKITVYDIGIVVIVAVISEKLFRKLFPPRKLLVVYEEYDPTEFINKLNTRKDKYKVEQKINVSAGLDIVEKEIKKYEGVVIYDVHSETRNKILKFCYGNDIRAYSTTKVSDILIRGAESLHIFDTPLLLYRNHGLSFEQRFLKRTMDILVSALMLLITSPIFLVASIAIKLYDGGPVFYRQARCTMNGKVFHIFKFRSMIVDAEKDGKSQPAADHDPRITPVGRILRATRLDELPQLINIFKGEMSFIGPRPTLTYHPWKLEEYTDFQKRRFEVRPGVTGLAQINGRKDIPWDRRIEYDVDYVKNMSFCLDFKILLKTIVKVFKMSDNVNTFETAKNKNS